MQQHYPALTNHLVNYQGTSQNHTLRPLPHKSITISNSFLILMIFPCL